MPCQNNENYEKLFMPLDHNENLEIHRIPRRNHENHKKKIIPCQNGNNSWNSFNFTSESWTSLKNKYYTPESEIQARTKKFTKI